MSSSNSFLKLHFLLTILGDTLPVRNSHPSQLRFNSKLKLDPVSEHFQVELTETRHQKLPSLFIFFNMNRWVFSWQVK